MASGSVVATWRICVPTCVAWPTTRRFSIGYGAGFCPFGPSRSTRATFARVTAVCCDRQLGYLDRPARPVRDGLRVRVLRDPIHKDSTLYEFARVLRQGSIGVDDYENRRWLDVTRAVDKGVCTLSDYSVLAGLNKHGALQRREKLCHQPVSE